MATTECTTYYRPVLKAYNETENLIYLYQPRCKMWACPYCAAINRSYWCKRAVAGIEHYRQQGVDGWTFVTITSHEKNKTLGKCLFVWPKGWAKLSSRIRYHHKGIKYLLIPEQHQDGRLHIHALASHGITTRFLKDNARACGLGYMGESEALGDARYAGYYCAKYLGKQTEIADWPGNFRRIRSSQKWPHPPDNDTWDGLEVDWNYLSTYPSDGLDYLAAGIKERQGIAVKIIK